MAASEVMVAASQVAATVAQAPVNWIGVVASSAAIGAAVNALASFVSQHVAWKREQAKLSEQRAPMQLDVALMLEAFAKQAAGYLDGCEARIAQWYAEQQGEEADEPPKWTPLKFDESLVKDWTAVPIVIVSHCRELPLALAASDAWIHDAFKEDWLEPVEANQVDAQRAILYGLLACELAHQIRAAIKAPASTLSTDCFTRLRREFEQVKNLYVNSQGIVELIPDLKARLMRELPMVAPHPALALAHR